MDKNKILTILNDWNFWHQDLPYGLLRKDYLQDLQRYLKTNQIVVIQGPRRAAKS